MKTYVKTIITAIIISIIYGWTHIEKMTNGNTIDHIAFIATILAIIITSIIIAYRIRRYKAKVKSNKKKNNEIWHKHLLK